MTDRSPSAYLTSALLHGGVVAVALLWATFFLSSPTPPKIFELVAGEGDNYAATAAPALGSAAGIQLKLPAPLPPAPAPAPVSAPALPAPAPVPAKPAVRPAQTVPNFARTVQRTVRRVENRIETRIKRREDAERRRQMTLEEFRKEHPSTGASSQTESRGIRGGVVGGSIANTTGGAEGRALAREQGDEIAAYWAMLESRVKSNFIQPADASDELTAKVEFYLGRDGSISRARIVQSSGNDAFDRSVLEAFNRTQPLLPPSFWKGGPVSLEFSMHSGDASG